MNDLYKGDLHLAEQHAAAWLEGRDKNDPRYLTDLGELAKFLMNGPQL